MRYTEPAPRRASSLKGGMDECPLGKAPENSEASVSLDPGCKLQERPGIAAL